ncbi:MAG: hypothetical protein AAGN35_01055 [Bacteroidota bacterium]
MYFYNKITKPCTYLFIAFFLTANLSFAGQLGGPSQQDIAKFNQALDAYDQGFQSVMGVWQIIEYDLSSGAAPTSENKQQLQYVINTLGSMTSDLDALASAAKPLDNQQIVSDISKMNQAHYGAIASAKTLLSGIQKSGQVDYQAVASTSSDLSSLERLIDCIRREIQVITGGK